MSTCAVGCSSASSSSLPVLQSGVSWQANLTFWCSCTCGVDSKDFDIPCNGQARGLFSLLYVTARHSAPSQTNRCSFSLKGIIEDLCKLTEVGTQPLCMVASTQPLGMNMRLHKAGGCLIDQLHTKTFGIQSLTYYSALHNG